MSDSPIKEALAALSRNASVVEMLAEGGTVLQDAIARPVTLQMRQASALRPAGEDSWRLHPRLREYLQDHLQLVTPFQSLKEVGHAIATLAWLRDEMESAVRERDVELFDSLAARTSSTLYDIADATDSNMAFLTGMVSLKYGTAQTLKAKIAENRWYDNQARILGSDLVRLDAQASKLAREARERRWEIAPLIHRVILSRMHRWQSELSEVLTLLRSEVFLKRDVRQDARNLARADAYMAQQPAWHGIEIDLAKPIPEVLLHAALPRLRPHVEPLDTDAMVRDDLAQLIAGMPPRKEPRQRPQSGPVRLVRPDPAAQSEAVLDVYAATLQQLKSAVVGAGEPVSLVRWHAREEAAAALRAPSTTALRPASWLMLAVCALEDREHRIQGRSVRFKVDLEMNPPPPGRRGAISFRDALVSVAP